MNTRPIWVSIYGQSLYLQALTAGLERRPGFEVVRINPFLPGVTERLAAQPAGLALLEEHDGLAQMALGLLGLGLSVIKLEPARERALWCTARYIPIAELERYARRVSELA